MRVFFKNLIWKIAFLSMFLYPQKLADFIRMIWNYYLSARFSYIVNSTGNCYLKSPYYIQGGKYIFIGKNFSAGPGFRIECYDSYLGSNYTPTIQIGDNVCFNFNCHLGAINKIIIGNSVLVGSNVLITDHSHGTSEGSDIEVPPAMRLLCTKGPVIIEDNVWIGEGVAILPNVTIGKNSIIGANSVITKDVPPYTVVSGNPYKILKSHINKI